MTITQITTFPVSLELPGGNQVSVTGTTGTELKDKLVAALKQRQHQQLDQQAILEALAAINS